MASGVDGTVVFQHFSLFLPAVLTAFFFGALVDRAQVSGGQVADCCDPLLNGTVQLPTGGFPGLM